MYAIHFQEIKSTTLILLPSHIHPPSEQQKDGFFCLNRFTVGMYLVLYASLILPNAFARTPNVDLVQGQSFRVVQQEGVWLHPPNSVLNMHNSSYLWRLFPSFKCAHFWYYFNHINVLNTNTVQREEFQVLLLKVHRQKWEEPAICIHLMKQTSEIWKNGSWLRYYSAPTAVQLLKQFSELIETVGCTGGNHRNP